MKLSLSDWLARELDEHKSVVSIQVRHQRAGANASPIATLDARKRDPGELANEVEERAMADADCHAGVQTYTLALVTKAGAVVSSRVERFEGTGAELGPATLALSAAASETPTGAGLVAQAHRHTEFLIKALAVSTEQRERAAERLVGHWRERAERAESEVQRLTEMGLTHLRADREHALALREADRKAELQTKALDRFALLAPSILNKFAGGTILTEKISPQMMMVMMFAESLDAEQIDRIMPVLRPEQCAVFIELIREAQKFAREREEKKAKEAEKLLATTTPAPAKTNGTTH